MTGEAGAHGAALILAAGAGRRMGRPKAEVVLGGRTLLERSAAIALAAGCGPVIAVLRAGVSAPAAVIPAINPDPDRGMGSSLRVGLAAAAQLPPEVDRLVVLLVDMPALSEAAVRRVAGAIGADAPLAMARYADSRGHPVAFRRDQWALIADAIPDDEDRGARAYLAAHPELLTLVDCADLATPDDVDTPEALAAAAAALG
jgi:nicotine blue oxidoreductase